MTLRLPGSAHPESKHPLPGLCNAVPLACLCFPRVILLCKGPQARRRSAGSCYQAQKGCGAPYGEDARGRAGRTALAVGRQFSLNESTVSIQQNFSKQKHTQNKGQLMKI